MKSIATLLSAAALGFSLTSGAAQAGELSVEVQGLTEMKGNLLVAVFKSKRTMVKTSNIE